jgi:hypothetical protein
MNELSSDGRTLVRIEVHSDKVWVEHNKHDKYNKYRHKRNKYKHKRNRRSLQLNRSYARNSKIRRFEGKRASDRGRISENESKFDSQAVGGNISASATGVCLQHTATIVFIIWVKAAPVLVLPFYALNSDCGVPATAIPSSVLMRYSTHVLESSS